MPRKIFSPASKLAVALVLARVLSFARAVAFPRYVELSGNEKFGLDYQSLSQAECSILSEHYTGTEAEEINNMDIQGCVRTNGDYFFGNPNTALLAYDFNITNDGFRCGVFYYTCLGKAPPTTAEVIGAATAPELVAAYTALVDNNC